VVRGTPVLVVRSTRWRGYRFTASNSATSTGAGTGPRAHAGVRRGPLRNVHRRSRTRRRVVLIAGGIGSHRRAPCSTACTAIQARSSLIHRSPRRRHRVPGGSRRARRRTRVVVHRIGRRRDRDDATDALEAAALAALVPDISQRTCTSAGPPAWWKPFAAGCAISESPAARSTTNPSVIRARCAAPSGPPGHMLGLILLANFHTTPGASSLLRPRSTVLPSRLVDGHLAPADVQLDDPAASHRLRARRRREHPMRRGGPAHGRRARSNRTAYGDVQVRAELVGAQSVDIQAVLLPSRPGAVTRDQPSAEPLLRQEALTRRVPHRVVTGATFTSVGYRDLFAGALDSLASADGTPS